MGGLRVGRVFSTARSRSFNAVAAALLILSTLSPLFTPQAAKAFGGGDGSATYPYRISDCTELQNIANNTSAHYVLTNDINCASPFTPIANFTGSLDGRNYQVANISVNIGSGSNAGMFAVINGGTVKNLKLANQFITGTDFVGGLAGQLTGGGVVDHVSAYGSYTGSHFVGALLGMITYGGNGSVSHSSSGGTITVDSGYRVGGLVGNMDSGSISDSYTTATINAGADVGDVGGLTGFMFHGTSVTRSYAAGTITNGTEIGGFVGFVWNVDGNANISDSFTATTISGGSAIGGFAGRNYGGSTNLADNFYDKTTTTGLFCDGYSGFAGCDAVNTDGNDGDHFKNTTSVDPYTTGSWDFDIVWQQSTGYPTLQDGTLDTLADIPAADSPTDLSGNPTGSSTIALSWTAPAANGGGETTDYVIEYKDDSASDWSTFNDGTSTSASATVTGLVPNTLYDFRVYAVNGGGQSAASSPIEVQTNTVATTITTCEELQDIKYDTSNSFILGNDIDCSETSSWNGGAGFEPINSFSGTFNGADHTISGMHIARGGGSSIGIFGKINSGTVTHLNISGGEVTGTSQVGMLAGWLQSGTVDHVTSSGNVFGNNDVGGLIGIVDCVAGDTVVTSSSANGSVSYFSSELAANYMGGLIGFVESSGHTITLNNLRAEGEVDATSPAGAWATGGLIGEINSYSDGVTNATLLSSTGAVSGSEAVGGLIGANYSYLVDGIGTLPGVLNITSSHSSNPSIGQDSIGGLIGLSNNASGGSTNISRSYSASAAVATGYYAGGIIGDAEGDGTGTISIDQTYSDTSAYTDPEFNGGDVGGIVGYSDMSGGLTISNSYNTGSISGYNYIGGILGEGDATLINTYSKGTITGVINEGVGSLVGYSWFGTISDSFATGGIYTTGGGEGSLGGLVGKSNGSEALGLVDDYYAPNLTYQNVCVGDGVFGDCTAQNMDEGSANYYFLSSNNPLSAWDFSSVWSEHSGDYPTLAYFDTSNSPVIHNCSQLQAIAENPSATYTLANDIDCSETSSWNGGAGFFPISNFSGELNGNGHTISGLHFYWPSNGNIGIFNDINGGYVHNFVIADANVSGYSNVGPLAGTVQGNGSHIDHVSTTNTQVKGRYTVGGLIGYMASYDTSEITVTNSSSAGTIGALHDSDSSDAYIGGLIGVVQATGNSLMDISNDSSSAAITAGDWSTQIGGLIGSLAADDQAGLNFHDLTATGNIEAYGANQVGGLVGYADVSSWVDITYQFRNISASGNLSRVVSNAGGLFGELDTNNSGHVSLRGASASGNIDMSEFGGNVAGGLIGELYANGGNASIRQSYATGNIYAPNSSWMGSLVGETDGGTVTVTNSYATGSVTGSWMIGGLLGAGDAVIANSYATGAITSTGGENVGGFAGWVGNGLIVNSFSTGLVSGADGNTDVTGFIGGYRNATLANNYYDATSSNQPNCSQIDGYTINNNDGQCQAVNGDGSDPYHFTGNNVFTPLDQWNFDDIWQVSLTAAPTLRTIGGFDGPDAPTNLVATGDKTNLHLSWDAPDYTGSRIVAYKVELKDPTSGSWRTAGFSTTTSMDIDEFAVFWSDRYQFRVTAIAEDSDGQPSSVLTYHTGVEYPVSNCEDLQNIGDDPTGQYFLTQDIDCSDTSTWNDGAGFTPIGMGTDGFTGTLDGQGHKITNLHINRDSIDGDPSAGLFYQIYGATLKNFSLVGGSIISSGEAGSIAAYAYATEVSRVYSNVPVASPDGEAVGGLFGEFSSEWGLDTATITESAYTGNVTGNDEVGGLVGYSSDNIYIENSFYRGTVTGTEGDEGGLVGYADGKLGVANSYAAGGISGSSEVGGLVGANGDDSSSFTNDFVSTSINSEDPDNRGYIVGNWWGDEVPTSNTFYDENPSGALPCTNQGSSTGCTGVNGEASQPDYFLNNHINPPLSSWDFEGIWQTQDNDFPVLQGFDYSESPITPTDLVVSDPTSGRVHLQWTALGSPDSYNVQYREADGDGEWLDYNHLSDGATDVTVNGLRHNTAYQFRVRAHYSGGWSEFTDAVSATTTNQIYNITNCDQLQDMSGDLNGDYQLMNNIDCSATSDWNGGQGFWPIGYLDWSNPFTGDLEGNGHTISGLTINRTDANEDSSGLLFNTRDSHISNLNFTGGSITSRYSAGALASFAFNTKIDNVVSDLDIQTLIVSETCTGGLVGCMSGDDPTTTYIRNSSVSGSVTGDYEVGGLVGYSYNTDIEQDFTTGDVVGLGSVGGIVGYAYQGGVTDSYASGDVSADDTDAGGLAGFSVGAAFVRSYSSGDIQAGDVAGGLIGNGSFIALIDSFSISRVGVGADTLGGLVGSLDGENYVSNNYWDRDRSLAPNCSGSDSSQGGCTPVNLEGDDTNHFVNTTSAAPLDGWDFDTIWVAHADRLPTFSSVPGAASSLLASPTAHSMHLTWSFNDDGGSPITNYELQYRLHGSEEWQDAVLLLDTSTQATLTGLAASTSYDFRVRAVNEHGVGPWSNITASTRAVSQAGPEVTTALSAGSANTGQLLSSGDLLELSPEDITANGTINLDDFSNYTGGAGQQLNLEVGQVVHFTITRSGVTEHHTATVKEIGDGYVILTIASTPFDVRINLGETKTIKIDGVNALKIKLLSTEGDRASLLFSKPGTSPHKPSTALQSPYDGLVLFTGLIGLLIIVLMLKRRQNASK